MKPIFVFLTLLLSLGDPTVTAHARSDPCEYFFRSLKALPNEKLTRRSGEHESFFDGKEYIGCEVRFVTNIRLVPDRNVIPNFSAQESTDLYLEGWRMNNSYAADGPGSSSFGIEKGKTLCLIMDHQPAYLDEKEGIIQSETITIVVQCRSTRN